ncbi:MAG: hypothetical protein AAF449_21810, partial [Myxococcota bacterium]
GDDDRALLEWLTKDIAPRGVRIELVGTKADKLAKSKQKPALAKIARAFAPNIADAVHLTSASHRQGLEPLLIHLQHLAGLDRPSPDNA